MSSVLRACAVSILLVSLIGLAPPAECRTIRVDRTWELIDGDLLAPDGAIHTDIFTVVEVPPNGDREQRFFSINFFGNVYDRFYINENGVISFGAPLSAPPRDLADVFTAGVPVIVPYFADADMSLGGNVGIAFTFATTMFVNMSSRHQGSTANSPLVNHMQVAFWGSLTDTDFRLELNYDALRWESGDLDGGTDGLGGRAPRVGFSDGFGRVYEIPGSGENGVLLGEGFNPQCPSGSLSVACNNYFFDFIGGLPHIDGVPIFAVVPEPFSAVLVLTGMGLRVLFRRRASPKHDDASRIAA